ncbi:MAG: alpha/beta hydrolase, partial [Kaistella sp.]
LYGEENIIVYGRSLGGTFAIKMAADNEPQKLILEATFYNLQDMASRWIPYAATEKISPKMTYHFQSDKNILDVNCPVYHFHGDKDFVVPVNSGKKLFEVLAEKKPELEKKFILIKGGSHDDLAKFDLYNTEMKLIL